MTNAYTQPHCIIFLLFGLPSLSSISFNPQSNAISDSFHAPFLFFSYFFYSVLFLFFFCSQDITTKTSMEVWYVGPPNLAVGVRRMQLKESLFLKVL